MRKNRTRVVWVVQVVGISQIHILRVFYFFLHRCYNHVHQFPNVFTYTHIHTRKVLKIQVQMFYEGFDDKISSQGK